ncbi:Prefoldin subunit 4 [Smittium mucronatum]|uniref:Prefoldin subunit 4 n=1 Tax=Smittium mucronatum TaxID=133383 RepID=A0A1R0H4B7_9FUNG|nr:Prefoldin subunit 4 [Smittium mucronatum]
MVGNISPETVSFSASLGIKLPTNQPTIKLFPDQMVVIGWRKRAAGRKFWPSPAQPIPPHFSRDHLIDKNEEADVEVSFEDQAQINRFSKINLQMELLESKYDDQKKEKEYIDDLSMEMELLDEDSQLDYKIGDAFVKMTVSQVQDRIELEKDSLEVRITSMKAELAAMTKEMEDLKAQLYSKFGSSINLDKD